MNNSSSLPLIYLITNRLQYSPHHHLQLEAIDLAAQIVPPGQLFIQIREKDWSARELREFVHIACSVAQPHGARVLVNDRLDVALAAGADGVHLRTSSLFTADARRIIHRENFLVGVSTHSLEEARLAHDNGADFIVCGPVYYTPSKAGYGVPLGRGQFAEICQQIKLPVLALGGITMANFREPLTVGAAGIAGIGLFKNIDELGTNLKMMLSSPLIPQD